ncbi:MAG: hypothetical protein ACXVJ1_11260, partial [Candidatus Angelobacter sp.]
DFWAASEALDDLIIRIGRMISYQEYNTKSPLNGLAAKWAAQNSSLLPVDPRPIAPPIEQPVEEPTSSTPSGPQSVAVPIPPPPSRTSTSAPDGEDPWEQKIVIS